MSIDVGNAMIYHPELGEEPAERLFYMEHNFRSTYSLCWLEAKDTEARAKLKELNIRPVAGTAPERGVPGEWMQATRLGVPVFHCLISRDSSDKLRLDDLVATRVLLD
ncbi:hypothetical protein ACTHR6_25030 [Ralstonia holmesii]|uniref:hypothetical protein n=1 Tax=Ralstonia TaxID=48736 RepID=UPI000469FBCF|nr:hypothetical protein [Ralstonia pickettii]